MQEVSKVLAWDRPHKKALAKAVERPGRVARHIRQHSSLRASEDIAQRSVLLNGSPKLTFSTPAAELDQMLEFIQHDPDGRGRFGGQTFYTPQPINQQLRLLTWCLARNAQGCRPRAVRHAETYL